MKNKTISGSFEDYLESIYLLQQKNNHVRVNEVAKDLGVSLPSVTVAIKKLSEEGFTIYEKYGLIKLTNKGKKLAINVYKKHQILSEFFIDVLKVDKEIALKDACLMEHGLSNETLIKLNKFVNKLKGGKK